MFKASQDYKVCWRPAKLHCKTLSQKKVKMEHYHLNHLNQRLLTGLQGEIFQMILNGGQCLAVSLAVITVQKVQRGGGQGCSSSSYNALENIYNQE